MAHTMTITAFTTATTNVWYTWNNTTNAMTTTGPTWNTWCGTPTTGTYYPTTTAWSNWNYVHEHTYRQYTPPVLTPAQIAEQKRRADEYTARLGKEREAAQAARKRAMELLVEELNEQQRKDVAERNFFIVEGGKSKKKYKIKTDGGAAGNIYVLGDNDNEVERYCAHAPYHHGCPEPDHFLSQKLMLQWAEDDMIKIANKTTIQPTRIAA